MGVDRQPGTVHGHAAHDVGRLAPDPRQGDQILDGGRHLAGEALDQRLGHPQQAAGLGPEEPAGVDQLLDGSRLGTGQRHRGRIGGEHRRGDLVDGLVRALGGQDGGDQQLERVFVIELAKLLGRAGVLGGQSHHHLAGPSFWGARPRHLSAGG